jgi:hypothetical protein
MSHTDKKQRTEEEISRKINERALYEQITLEEYKKFMRIAQTNQAAKNEPWEQYVMMPLIQAFNRLHRAEPCILLARHFFDIGDNTNAFHWGWTACNLECPKQMCPHEEKLYRKTRWFILCVVTLAIGCEMNAMTLQVCKEILAEPNRSHLTEHELEEVTQIVKLCNEVAKRQ